METKTKTYAARGLIEWRLALTVAGVIIYVDFTGGTMGSNGVLPGKYTTSDPLIQKLIEESEHFDKYNDKSRRIYAVR